MSIEHIFSQQIFEICFLELCPLEIQSTLRTIRCYGEIVPEFLVQKHPDILFSSCNFNILFVSSVEEVEKSKHQFYFREKQFTLVDLFSTFSLTC